MENLGNIKLTNMQNHFISQAKELGELIFYNLNSEARGRKICKSLVRKNLLQEHEQEGNIIYYLTTTGVNYVNSTTPSVISPIPLEIKNKEKEEFSQEDIWEKESEDNSEEESEESWVEEKARVDKQEWVEGEEEFSAYIKKQEQEEEKKEKEERIEIRQEREAKTLSPIGSIKKGDTIKTSSCTGIIVKYCSNKEIHLDCKGTTSIISKVDILEILKN